MEKDSASKVLGVPLVQTTRGDRVENVHSGHIAVVSLEGEGFLLAQAGDADIMSYLRSTAKPVQAFAAVLGGVLESYGLEEDALAIFAALSKVRRSISSCSRACCS